MPSHIPTGMLRLYVTLQAPTVAQDDYGQATTSWLNVAGLRAHVDGAREAETMYEGGIATRSDYTFITGWYPAVTTQHRLKWTDQGRDRIFNIRAVWDRDQRQRRLQIEATEVMP